MKNILEFLSLYEEFEILAFSEDMIFNMPIEVTYHQKWLDSLGMAPMRCVHQLLFKQIPTGKGYSICQQVQTEAN